MKNIRMRRDTMGGCTYDLGCYNTTQILWMLGEEPERVQAVADFSDEHIDLFTTALLSFKGGKRAQLNCGFTLATDADKRVDRFQIHGTKGCIKSATEFNECGELKYTLTTDEGTVEKSVNAPQNYKLEVEQLGRCIAGESLPHVSNEFSRMNTRTLDRVLKAIGY
jgi:predicted dehydrogenase